MSFDPNKYVAQTETKSGFDPNKYISNSSGVPLEPPSVKKDINKGEAGLQGFGQAASFGYLPNLQAATEPITDKIFGFVTGKDVQDPRSYVERRDAAIDRDKELQKSGAYTAGQVAGSLVTPMPELGIIKGGKIAKAAASGLLSGALYNPGEEKGKISGLQIGERAQEGLKSGLMSGGVQGLLSGVGKIASKWSNKAEGLKKASNMSAIATAGAQKGDITKLLNKNQINEVGEFLKKENLVGAGKNFEDVYNGTQRIIKEDGPKIGQIYDSVQKDISDPNFLNKLKPEQLEKINSTSLNPSQMASELGSKFSQELKGKAGGKAAFGRVQTELETLAELGDNVNMDQLLETRRSFDDLINYDKSVKDMPLAQQYLKKTRDYIQEKINNRIEALDNVVGGDKLKQLKVLNNRYKNASTAFNISKSKLAGEEAKLLFGITDRQAALGGAGLGVAYNLATGDTSPEALAKSVGLGLIAGGLSKGAKRYGPGLITSGLDLSSKLSKIDPTAPAAGIASKLIDKISPEKLGGLIDKVRRGE